MNNLCLGCARSLFTASNKWKHQLENSYGPDLISVDNYVRLAIRRNPSILLPFTDIMSVLSKLTHESCKLYNMTTYDNFIVVGDICWRW